MSVLDTLLQGISTVAIMGHRRPDGDCVGSCLGLYNYLKEQYPGLQTVLYLERPADKFNYLQNFEAIVSDDQEDREFDLCICLDSSDKDRFGSFDKYLDTAKSSLCIDHHITNTGYAGTNVIETGSSSTCEVLYGLLDETKISKAVAECIYTGIAHDTGVFKYSNTSSKTMNIAGKLMDMGVNFSRIIDESFYKKTYVQNQIMGRALLESVTILDGRCIFGVVREKDMIFYGASSKDMDGIIDQLRIIEGIECAIFLYETGNQEYKVSLRSNDVVDVSSIATYFGGGGHVKAAGCTMSGSIHDVINNLSSHIEKQLNKSAASSTPQ